MAKVSIDRERCKGCHFCIAVCPKKIMVVEKRYNQKGYPPVEITEIEECTGCALCAEMCPDVCIRVWT